MSKFDYIRVTLSEMLPGGAHVIYSYPQGEADDAEAVFDGNAAIGEFISLRECYALWSTPKGHYFSLVTPNPSGGSLTLTFRLDNECAMAGKRIVGILAELKKVLVVDRALSSEVVDRALTGLGLATVPEKLKSWQYEKPLTSASAPKRPFCYRTYASSSELDAILSFPSQVEYACFDRVLAVPATTSLRPGSRLDRITAPVKREYTVVTPTGCTASRQVVADGDRLTLTFTKPGFNPRVENISVGAPSPYVRYEGPALRVKTAAESGLGFVRRVPLHVRSAKGQPVNGFTINVNGKPINTMEPYIDITERDLSPTAKTEIQVASNNYKPLKVVKTPAELVDCERLELVLEPVEQGITLRLDFGGGRIFNQEITLEKNTQEYSQLHSGNFHGFRAHRLTVAGNAEVYNVDMNSPIRPVAQGAAPVQQGVTPQAPDMPRAASAQGTQDAAHRRPVAPVFDRDTPDSRRERKEMRLRDKEIKKEIEAGAAQSDEPAEATFSIEEKRSNKGLWALVVVLALALCGGIAYFLWPDSFSRGAEVAQTADSTEVTLADGTVVAAETAAPAPASADEAADIEYLNENTKTWKLSELRTEKYRALLHAIEEGDIDAFLANDYVAIDRNLTNKTARSIADMLWAAKGSPNQTSNEKAMRKNFKDSTVAVWDLYEAVARVKPAEPNTTPRPVK
ncbi:MAG: hypothetical protein NC187_08710 [Candidatus Amulumruptor caecigallinarius]|nr:hypothetical protein [Candidatus Amulumruptor caecigallinarius]MCM1397549.1 hypothetical protein [Candidatus Amulumruptor caecigallinarius]MCM1454451.1 hypothetical protein [bacterium]